MYDLDFEFYDLHDVPAEQSLKFEPRIGAYHLMPNLTYVASVPATEALTVAYYQNDYTSIFPQYDPQQHFIIEGAVGRYSVFSLVENGTSENQPLPPGYYRLVRLGTYGWVCQPFEPVLDDWVELPDSPANRLLEDLTSFWNQKGVYLENGLRHRKSALLYGSPGHGKSRTILQALQTQGDLRVIFITEAVEPSVLTEYQNALNGSPIVFVFEELTNYRGDRLSNLLNFLDGQDSWANAYCIATTNYPAELADNIIDRPGRFEVLIEFEALGEKGRTMYFEHFGIQPTPELLKATYGWSIDYLRHLVLQNKTFGANLLTTIEKIKADRQKVSRSFKGGLGF